MTRGDGAEGLVVLVRMGDWLEHPLTVEVERGQVAASAATRGWPLPGRPAEILDLAGRWTPSKDYSTNGPAVSLPGPFNAKLVSRDVDPARSAGKAVYLRHEGKPGHHPPGSSRAATSAGTITALATPRS